MGNNWKSVETPSGTILSRINESFVELSKSCHQSFPNLRNSDTLLITSDYSGDSADYPYYVFSFLITTIDAWNLWETERKKIREACFSDKRRMTFKKLSDQQRQKALPLYLKSANQLKGISFSVVIDKKCHSFFDHIYDKPKPEFEPFGKWKHSVLEKAGRITHILSILISGLATQGQNIIWITDEDSIAANDEYVCNLTNLFGWTLSLYLSFDLGHIRCGTSRCDDGTLQLEDLLAIPDLVAGAISEQYRVKKETDTAWDEVFFMYRPDFSEKTQAITWWLSDTKTPLNKLVYHIKNKKEKTVGSLIHFYNQAIDS